MIRQRLHAIDTGRAAPALLGEGRVDTDGEDGDVVAEGGFGDRVDRVFEFFSIDGDSGSIITHIFKLIFPVETMQAATEIMLINILQRAVTMSDGTSIEPDDLMLEHVEVAAGPGDTPAAPAPETLPPSVRRLAADKKVDLSQVSGTGPGGRITKGDVLLYLEAREAQAASAKIAPPVDSEPTAEAAAEETSRKPMTPIRQRIAARLLEARQNTAMLTTFNDVDMSRVMEIRSHYKDAFQKKYSVSLGFMSFFIKAAVEALKEFPEINAFIDGKEIVYHHYYHIGVAIGTGEGSWCR